MRGTCNSTIFENQWYPTCLHADRYIARRKRLSTLLVGTQGPVHVQPRKCTDNQVLLLFPRPCNASQIALSKATHGQSMVALSKRPGVREAPVMQPFVPPNAKARGELSCPNDMSSWLARGKHPM